MSRSVCHRSSQASFIPGRKRSKRSNRGILSLPFQPQPNSKYKTSMCRDLRQQGGCPRGSNCTFAHTQDELEK